MVRVRTENSGLSTVTTVAAPGPLPARTTDRDTEQLLVELLGPLRVTLDGELAGLTGPVQCGLFARLVLANGEAVSFETLMEALWPGRDPELARPNLQQQILQLRRAVGRKRIETVGKRAYRLKLSPNQVDSILAEDALHSARSLSMVDPPAALPILRAAHQRFRGPPLVEFASHDWARDEAVRLEQLREDIKSLEIELRLETGDVTSLIPELRVLTENNPENERYWATLMTALYCDGRQQEALNTYQDARRRMKQQFGLDPSPDLQALELRILKHDPTLKPSARGGAPTLEPPAPEPAPAELNGCGCWIDPSSLAHIGREAELDRIEKAVAGGAGLVLISGESGIGKTRLAMEFARQSSAHKVFYGNCDDSGGRAFPPIADIVEHAESDNQGLLQRLEAEASVDALRRLISDDESGSLPETSRSALLAALSALLGHVAADGPPVLVIDQLSQADADTLEVLARLVSPLATSPVVIIGITQPTALAPNAPVATWLHSLSHQVSVTDVRLKPLGAAQVGQLARALGQDDPDQANLLRASGGSPMFVEHLVRQGSDDDSTLARLAWRRISSCSAPAIALLRAAAIDGLRPKGWLMLELAALDPGDADAALSEVIADGLLRPMADVESTRFSGESAPATDRYQFVHGLIRTTLLGDIGPEHRRALHQRAAELLEQRRTAGDLVRPGDIARHYLAAAPSAGRGPAIAWLRESAASAVRNSAYERASSELTSALGLTSSDADDDELAAKLLIERGRVLSTYVHQGDGRALLELAIQRARRAGRADLAAVAALEVGGVLAMGDVTDPSIERVVTDALDHLGDTNSQLRAELLARLAQLRYATAPAPERIAMCDEAEQLTQGSPADVRCRIGINRFWACDFDADPVITWALIERIGSLAAQAGDRMLALQVLKCRLHTAIKGGDLEAADDVAARFAASAAEVGSADMIRLDLLYQAMRAGTRGHFVRAGEFADESKQLLAETGRAQHAAMVDGLVRLPWFTMCGDHHTSEGILQLLGAEAEPAPMWTIFEAWSRAVSGDLDAAVAAADRFDLNDFIGAELRQNSGLIASTAVSVALLTGQSAWAAPLAEWFRRDPEASIHVGQTMFLGYAWHYLGIAESMLKGPEHAEAAVEALANAADKSKRAGATPWRLFAEVHLARLGVGPGGVGSANPGPLATEADALGLHWIGTDARALL